VPGFSSPGHTGTANRDESLLRLVFPTGPGTGRPPKYVFHALSGNSMNVSKSAPSLGVLLLLALGATPGTAGAQEAADTLRRQYRLPQPSTFVTDARGSVISPGLTIGVPSGFGADWGDAFVGVGIQHRTRTLRNADAGVVVGFGLGDAQRLVGLELAITSYGTVRSCCRGALSAKVHRVLPGDVSVAVGVENGAILGVSDAGTSLYAAGSKVFLLRDDPGSFLGTLAVTAGAGNGRFRRERDILIDRETISPFGSVGVRVAPPASVVASWTGQDLVAGVSIVPFRRIPLFVTPAVADLTREPRFLLGLGYGFSYGSLF
jgi:hypothetical protein